MSWCLIKLIILNNYLQGTGTLLDSHTKNAIYTTHRGSVWKQSVRYGLIFLKCRPSVSTSYLEAICMNCVGWYSVHLQSLSQSYKILNITGFLSSKATLYTKKLHFFDQLLLHNKFYGSESTFLFMPSVSH